MYERGSKMKIIQLLEFYKKKNCGYPTITIILLIMYQKVKFE